MNVGRVLWSVCCFLIVCDSKGPFVAFCGAEKKQMCDRIVTSVVCEAVFPIIGSSSKHGSV